MKEKKKERKKTKPLDPKGRTPPFRGPTCFLSFHSERIVD